MRYQETLCAGALVSLLAGCAGSSGAVPPANTAQAFQQDAHARKRGKIVKAHFTIEWPRRRVKSRGPDYISPSTMSIIVMVNPDATKPGPVTIANNPGTGKSTISIDAPVGVDQFVFSLWDKPQKRHERKPVGNELGEAVIPRKKIVAGKQNTLKVTIDAVPASVTAAPLPNQPFLETDAQTGGYDLVGNIAAVFAVTAYDAGGALIVPPGKPSYGLSVGLNSQPYLAVRRRPGKSNQFLVGIAAAAASAQELTVQPSATSADGRTVVHGTAVPLNALSAIYVGYQTGNGAKIAAYDSNGNALSLPDTAFAGLSDPQAIAYDPAASRLFVADAGSGTVQAFDTTGQTVAGYTPPALAGANGVTYDPGLNSVYASGTSGVLEFSPSGAGVTLPGGAFSQTASPAGISFIPAAPTVYMGPTVDWIVVGNDATFSYDYYDESGTYVISRPISTSSYKITAAPIAGILEETLTSIPLIFASGGTSGGTAPNGFLVPQEFSGGDWTKPPTATDSAFAGMAVDPTIGDPNSTPSTPWGELWVAKPDTNTVQAYFIENLGKGPDTAHVITTPAGSGLAQPQGIAVVP